MDFLRFETGITKLEDVRNFVKDDTFSVVDFELFGPQANYEAFIRHAVVVDGVTCNLYKNTAFGSIPLNKGTTGVVGMMGGVGGTVGFGIPPKEMTPDEDKVYRFLDNLDKLMDLPRVLTKLAAKKKETLQVYLVRSFLPTPFPGGILDDAVSTAKKWAKKVYCAR